LLTELISLTLLIFKAELEIKKATRSKRMEKEELLSSGLLELYVLGETTPLENELIGEMGLQFPELFEEIKAIEIALEQYAVNNAIKPDAIIKPFLLATIDYMDRMMAGEIPQAPPILSDKSLVADYIQWLERPDMILPEEFDEVFAKILNHDERGITAIAWIKSMAPQEVHDHEYEKFLIVEGTCSIHIEEEVHALVPGDYLTIPLLKKHHVLVTSDVPCKVILQRIAA
jgi:mannose-6-phosphate isomerase-like protein (cupin superfamily)